MASSLPNNRIEHYAGSAGASPARLMRNVPHRFPNVGDPERTTITAQAFLPVIFCAQDTDTHKASQYLALLGSPSVCGVHGSVSLCAHVVGRDADATAFPHPSPLPVGEGDGNSFSCGRRSG